MRGAWIKRIKKGDVLRSRSGVLRVVRSVQHSGPSINKTSVIFTIMHCSWTKRCYTVYVGNDLIQMGYRPTRVFQPLRTKVDRKIEAEFGAHRPKLHCCDVAGIQ